MIRGMALCSALLLVASPLAAEQLYRGGGWPAVASDRKAAAVGDSVSILIVEATKASSKLENNSGRASQVGGSFQAGGIDEDASIQFGGSYAGRGEVVRAEQFVAQISANVTGLSPNGDFLIEGRQQMLINGEHTVIAVRGRIRPQDISSDNTVPSSRIADAQIDYDGKGFVSRSAKPGILNRIFSFLGIG
ncbi:MAG: flagellar basal body L-ring protein FlgH [Candidatus Andeanibacterium colombiense]|uniref:Flagellar basal body L-ring protein FlgH n=1 Tax=Candidatus Andeanibacterium colombiense TaxID=3121345 RepID=A0AAJ5X8R0_9SPHN|nr:MAG: flagellar basal body L-ring protein FlgH [Sphingomonadaceae bacterium]